MGICQSKAKNRTNEIEKKEKRENGTTTPHEGQTNEVVETKKSINLKKLKSGDKITAFSENTINPVTVDATEVASIAAVASASVAASVDVPSQKKKKIIILNGAPGAGKDTQCHLLLEKFNFHLLVCSTILKKYLEECKKNEANNVEKKTENELKEEEKILDDIKKSFADGSLVPDETVIKIFTKELNSILNDENNKAEGILINGFPRTEQQALLFKKSNIPVDVLININVSQEVLWARSGGRLIDPETNISYDLNIIELMKKKKRGDILDEEQLKIISHNENYEKLSDEILSRLKRREDDEPAVFDKRYYLYKENETKVLSVFHDICKNVDGNKRPIEVFNEISKIIEQI